MILDTTFLIDVLKGVPTAAKKAEQLDKINMPALTTSVTVFELWQGVHDASKKEKERVLELLKGYGLYPLDFESAQYAGEIFDTLCRHGLEIDTEDCMIAGIARAHNEPVLTRNVAHFSRISGLRVEKY